MHILDEKLRAPALRVEGWMNAPSGGALSLGDLRGQVVLIDFWDYTCVNCLHTLPYLKEWHTRYAPHGLMIIGVHAPEFEFAHNRELIAQAVQRLGLLYPVALDNRFQTWDAFANRAWPAKYLIDQHGYIRAFHRGEGAYAEFESCIQQLLHEMDSALVFPTPMAPVREMDQPEAACHQPTPELYLGWSRGEIDNRKEALSERIMHFDAPPDRVKEDTVYLDGPWFTAHEYIETVSDENARIHLNYQAAQVNLVASGMVADTVGPVKISLLLDGHPLPHDGWGEDVALEGEQTVIHIHEPRMYSLVSHAGFERHQLTIDVVGAGLRAYAFTFVGCVIR